MSLRPVDAQTAIARTQDVGRQQHQRDGEAATAQQMFAATLRQKVEREQSQVKQPPQSGQVGLQQRGGRGRGGRDESTPEERGGGQEQESSYTAPGRGPREPDKGTRLDVKI